MRLMPHAPPASPENDRMRPVHTRPALAALLILAVPFASAADPDNSGPAKLKTLSWLGGPGRDEVLGVAVTPELDVLVAGNAVNLTLPGVKPAILGPDGTFDKDAAPPPPDPKKKTDWTHPSTHGFVARLDADGSKVLGYTRFGYGKATLRKLLLDDKGVPYVLANAKEEMELGGTKGAGTFVAKLSKDLTKVETAVFHKDAMDFGVDGNGDFVILTKAKMTRYPAAGGAAKWTVSWKSHGDNRPGAMTVSPQTGVACVTGYGMTNTGKEPYKDPYGYGFDRDGKEVWAIWNPDPKKEKDAKFSTPELKTNGLMADTTGHAAAFGAGGKVYFMLFADGGNSVCTRDPLDVDKSLDKSIFDGVHQNGPGFGFKGASKSSVVFRLDSSKGTLEKGTWMTAWLSPQRANGLGIDAAASDEKGRQFLAGGSAFGCPTKSPWYACKEGGYQGGGFLAILDADFKLTQCGYFPGSKGMKSVAARGGVVVVGGSVGEWEDEPSKTAPRTFNPIQKTYGGGDTDGYFAIFRIN